MAASAVECQSVTVEQDLDTTVASSLNPSNAGQAVTFAAKVTSVSGSPNGETITFKNGTTLPEALVLAEALESNTPAGRCLAHWRRVIEAGGGKPAQWLGEAGPFPPLFLWVVQKSGEDIAGGFQKAAEIYQARASYRIELALYGYTQGRVSKGRRTRITFEHAAPSSEVVVAAARR